VDTDLLFVVALVAFYLLRQLSSRRQPAQKKPQPGRPQPEAIDTEPGLDDALAEIRRALGMEPAPGPPAPEASTRPAPEPVPRNRLEPAARPLSKPVTVAAPRPRDTFRQVETGRIETEEAFQRGLPTFRNPLEGHTHARPAPKVARAVPKAPEPKPTERLLATRRQLRDAFILKEILGPPRSRQPRIR
jgi:hypothetical protein